MATRRQKTGLGQCGQCACFNLRKTTRAITRLYDRAFQPYGLRATQFQILAAIANRGPINISDLANGIVMDRTTLSRDLGPLEKRGWVRVQSGKDRRTRPVALTADGRRLLKEALPAWEETQTRVVEGMGMDRFRVLLKDLSSALSIAQGAEKAA